MTRKISSNWYEERIQCGPGVLGAGTILPSGLNATPGVVKSRMLKSRSKSRARFSESIVGPAGRIWIVE
jgi:hypothetical protein